MAVAITIRDVPDDVRDELAARAARKGQSLQEYLRGFLVEAASKPRVDDVITRARARSRQQAFVSTPRPFSKPVTLIGDSHRVVDASALVAMLIDGGPAGRWATACAAPSPISCRTSRRQTPDPPGT